MSNFALSTNSPYLNVIQSLNYALANMGTTSAYSNSSSISGNVLVANTVTGQISTINYNGTTSGNVVSYLYGYVDIKYANSATGGSGFSSNCTDASYFGVYNTPIPVESSNPVNYQWTQVAGGFGTTKGLYYTTSGGGTINFSIGTTAPSQYYAPVIDNQPILLATLANSIVVSNSIQPGAVTNVQVAGNTITGYNIQLGTITANLIAANTVFIGQSLQSTNATFESPTTQGFWLDAITGNAAFGGNLTVGANLNVSGLITASNLQTNTVSTTNIVSQSVSQGNAVTSSTTITITDPTNNLPYFYTYGNVSINLPSTSGISNYITGVLATDIEFDYTGGGSTQTWILTFSLFKNNSAVVTQTFRYDVDSVNQSRFNNITPFAYLDTGLSANTNYVYSMGLSVSPGSTSVPQLLLKSGSLICQILKR